MSGSLSEYGRLTRVLVKHARDAFVSNDAIAGQWKALKFSGPPDFARAATESDRFLEIVASTGAEMVLLPPNESVSLDSIYTRDASVVIPSGVVLCNMSKRTRATEPSVQERTLRGAGCTIAGAIADSGRLEGGDLIWLDARTVVVGQGVRTNAEGIRDLQNVMGVSVEVVVVPLPDYPGLHDVMHLMSLVSPVDADLVVVYARLLPEALRRMLLDRGYRLIAVPDEEFETMGTNVFALAPRECVMLTGNPVTQSALERAGACVHTYEGGEISLKGGGGPTCLTRPLARS